MTAPEQKEEAPTPTQAGWTTVRAAARKYSVPAVTIRKHIRLGNIIARRIGVRSVRVDPESLHAFMMGSPMGPESQAPKT